MSSQVKWMHSTMPNAPVVSNNWGDMTALLDDCLVNGWNTQTPSTLTSADNIATLTFASAHGYQIYQVILISGADQPEYNGEFIVTNVTTYTVTFSVTGYPTSPATGTISVKVAPLGFNIEFTGTNKRVYRSPNTESHRAFLRVDNSLPTGYTTTWAKFARVTAAESMTDIDTFVGVRAPYDAAAPTKNEIPSGSYYGWFKWYYGQSGANDSAGDGGTAARSWVLIGDDRGFYLACGTNWGGRVLYVFNDFLSFKPSDNYATLFMACERYLTAGDVNGSSGPSYNQYAYISHNTTGKLLLRSFTQIGDPVRVGLFSLNDANTEVYSGYSSYFPYPNGPDYSAILHPVYLREPTGGHMRGIASGLFWMHQTNPFQHLTVLSDVIGYPGRKFLVVTVERYTGGNTAAFAFDITGPWR